MSEEFLDCRHTWDGPDEDSYCTSCGMGRQAWNIIQRLQNHIKDLLAACEAGGEFNGEDLDGPALLGVAAKYLDHVFLDSRHDLFDLLNAKADAEEAAIQQARGDHGTE